MSFPDKASALTDLLTTVPAKFQQARDSGELLYFESTAKDVYSQGKRFNVRCCPALQHKEDAKEPDVKRRKIEPFRPPYVPELYVGCLKGLEDTEDMAVLFNKYSLLPEHLLLVSTTDQPQSLPPTPHQLALAYLILAAAARHPTKPRKLLAFYNCSAVAGASQTWRHLQFIEAQSLPLEEWSRELDCGRTNRAVVHPTLPYLHITHPLSFPGLELEGNDEQLVDALAPALMQCLDLGIDAVRRENGKQDGGFNLIMDLNYLHLIPRSAPSFNGLELNALGYAGMLLVKSEEEGAALDPMAALTACGVAREWGEQAVKAAEVIQGHAEWM